MLLSICGKIIFQKQWDDKHRIEDRGYLWMRSYREHTGSRNVLVLGLIIGSHFIIKL